MPSLALASLALASLARAQGGHGGVSNSGMGQGEARISSRSDVRLAMESLPGTSGAAVSALGQRVATRMQQIRTCYDQVVEVRPTVVGMLRLRFSLGERGQPQVELERNSVSDREVVECISRELRNLQCNGLPRPAHAVVALTLSNTAARGAGEAAQAARSAQQVQTTADAQGRPTAEGSAEDGRVRFTLTGPAAGTDAAVAAGQRAMMSALPGLLDCRRRAGRRNQDPSGEMSITLTIRPSRAVASRVSRSTVADERAQRCVAQALERITDRPDAGSANVDVVLRFGPEPAQ